ncbi:MAG: four helix bundle protein [Bacteroidota bacterium]|jgi:four helix bundle protein|nr:four helix bundle protein [Bacteroidota bacterium]
MNCIKNFEDLVIWQKARSLSNLVYPLTFIEPISLDFRYKDQLRGVCSNVMDNIAEGFDRGNKKEFIECLYSTKRELVKLKSQLYRGLDNKYFFKEDFNELYKLADELSKMLGCLISYLKRKKIKEKKIKIDSKWSKKLKTKNRKHIK